MSLVKVNVSIDERFDIEVDVDDVLSKADTSEILSELASRNLGESDLEYLKDIYGGDEPDIPCETLDDQMKRDYILKIFDKYTLTQIENALPE